MPLPFLPAHRVVHPVNNNAWAFLPTLPIALSEVQVRTTIRNPPLLLVVHSPTDQVLRAARLFLSVRPSWNPLATFHLINPLCPQPNVASTQSQAEQPVWQAWAGAASLPPPGLPCSSVLRALSLFTGGAQMATPDRGISISMPLQDVSNSYLSFETDRLTHCFFIYVSTHSH